jgi:phosphonoacetaldehyde hydrolase
MSESPRIKAAVLDWAGTVIDHGSRAPMGAFMRAFAEFGVAIEVADARAPMGMAKWDHIRAIGDIPRVREAWRARHGRSVTDGDVDAIFKVFEPMNVASVVEHAALVPGTMDAVRSLQARGIRIASTTGYTRPIMERLLPLARAAGYAPEVVVCAGDLPAGRPSPLMMWHAMAQLGVWPADRVVKVDDTPVGLAEARNAGTWTVGVALTGNIAGLSEVELAALGATDLASLRARSTAELTAGGADLVIDGIADLPAAIETIEGWLAEGRRPPRPPG